MYTKQTNRFALFYFISFFAISYLMGYLMLYLPMISINNYSAVYSILSSTACCVIAIVIYFVWTKKSPIEVLRLKTLSLKNVVILVFLSFSMLPLVGFLSTLSSLFFPVVIEGSINAVTSSGLLLSLLAIALTPAITEELIFRGILLSGYRQLGALKAAFCSSLLFGLLHMNPQQSFYAFFIGFLLSLLVERSNSIFAGIIPHFIINGTSTFLSFLPVYESAEVMEELTPMMAFQSITLFFLFSLPFLFFFLYLFLKANPKRTDSIAAPYSTPDETDTHAEWNSGTTAHFDPGFDSAYARAKVTVQKNVHQKEQFLTPSIWLIFAISTVFFILFSL